jgi:hypothetical protein
MKKMATNNCDNFGNPINVANGGTGLTTRTAHSIQIGNGTSSPTQLTVGATGTVLIGNTGADPSFSATPTVTSITFGSGTALGTYTEGTWTPTLTGGTTTGTTTYTSQTGYYTQIGRMIIVIGTIVITAATGTGNVIIGGLPQTVSNSVASARNGSVYMNGSSWAWPVSSATLICRAIANTTHIQLVTGKSASSTSFVNMTNAALTLTFTQCYFM